MLRAKVVISVLLIAVAARVIAIEDGVMTLASVTGQGWQAHGIRARLRLATDIGLELSVERARVAGIDDELRALQVTCANLKIHAERFSCAAARVRGLLPYAGRQDFVAAVSYDRRSGALELHAAGVALAQGSARLDLELREHAWTAAIDLQRADVQQLLQLAQRFAVLAGFSGSGNMDVQAQARGRGSGPEEIRWRVDMRSLGVNNTAGTLASENLSLRSSGTASRDSAGWNFAAAIDAPAGQGYAEPVFVDFGSYALTAQLQGHWSTTKLELRHFSVAQRQLAALSGSGTLSLGEKMLATDLRVDIQGLEFPGAYTTYLQPFLLNTSFKALQTAGTVRGRIVATDNAPTAVELELSGLSASDGTPRLALHGIEGTIRWDHAQENESTAPTSQLRWRSGSLLGLQLGPVDLKLQAWGTTLRLAEPARIPIFDGALAIDALRIRKVGTPQVAFMLDANIEPVNVAQLCRAFGWPEFGGALAGRITKLRLEDGVMTLGATLNAQIFDGQVAIGNMRLENAFGAWPRFQADLALRNLDLRQVTQAFSFGLITGRLSGDIDRLTLFNWQPVSFDARFYTPDNDRSRHRISQRAVQNIGSIGGSGAGVAAALQTGFLKFFEDFNYDRLGISCRLENEVCRMNGIAPAGNGYYLVKGSGLPRIDVIGNAERVDWPRMVAQLKAVTESSGPVVR